MIAAMDQLTVVGRRGVAHDLLVSLQSLGVVQIDPIEPEKVPLERMRLDADTRGAKENWDAVVARSGALLDALEGEAGEASARSEVPSSLAELKSYLKTTGTQIDQLVAERSEARDELELIATFLPVFRDLAPFLALLEGSRFLFGTAFMVTAERLEAVRKELEGVMEGRLQVFLRDRGRSFLVIAVVLRTDEGRLRTAISRVGLSEILIPDRYADLGFAKAAHTMEERSQTLPKRIRAIEEDLAKLRNQHAARLRAVHQVARNQQARYERLEDLAAGRYSFALQGWVPSSDRNRVAESLRKQFGDGILIEARAADEHHDHDVPVKLENPAWVKPFEGLLALFAPPKYGSFDPSWTLAVFFPLFFGLVVGDIGFGLLFAALGWWLRRRGEQGKALDLGPLGIVINARALRPISTVIYWCAGWSVLFGFLYGEFFGNFLEKWPPGRPIFYTTLHEPEGYGLINIVLFRVEVFTPLLLLSIGFGVFQVLWGWLIRVIYGFRHHDMKHVYEGIGMLGGLAAIVIFAAAFLSGAVGPLVTVVVIIGFAVFLVCTVLARMPLMLVEIISNSGNILSYLRLFAVGLSAALVANLATNLGFAIGGTLPIIGPILGILVGLAVHLIAIALTIIGHTLQPLRLQYVEFFTKFGFYDENGRPYRPFRLLGGKS